MGAEPEVTAEGAAAEEAEVKKEPGAEVEREMEKEAGVKGEAKGEAVWKERWSRFLEPFLRMWVLLATAAAVSKEWLVGVPEKLLRTWVLLAMAVAVGVEKTCGWVQRRARELAEVLKERLWEVLAGLAHIFMLSVLGMAVFGNIHAPASGYHQFMGLVPSAEETALRHGQQGSSLYSRISNPALAWETPGRWWYADRVGVCRAWGQAGHPLNPKTFCWLSEEPEVLSGPWDEEVGEAVPILAVQQPVCPRYFHLATSGGPLPPAMLVGPPEHDIRSSGSHGRPHGLYGGAAVLGVAVASLHLGSLILAMI